MAKKISEFMPKIQTKRKASQLATKKKPPIPKIQTTRKISQAASKKITQLGDLTEQLFAGKISLEDYTKAFATDAKETYSSARRWVLGGEESVSKTFTGANLDKIKSRSKTLWDKMTQGLTSAEKTKLLNEVGKIPPNTVIQPDMSTWGESFYADPMGKVKIAGKPGQARYAIPTGMEEARATVATTRGAKLAGGAAAEGAAAKGLMGMLKSHPIMSTLGFITFCYGMSSLMKKIKAPDLLALQMKLQGAMQPTPEMMTNQAKIDILSQRLMGGPIAPMMTQAAPTGMGVTSGERLIGNPGGAGADREAMLNMLGEG